MIPALHVAPRIGQVDRSSSSWPATASPSLRRTTASPAPPRGRPAGGGRAASSSRMVDASCRRVKRSFAVVGMFVHTCTVRQERPHNRRVRTDNQCSPRRSSCHVHSLSAGLDQRLRDSPVLSRLVPACAVVLSCRTTGSWVPGRTPRGAAAAAAVTLSRRRCPRRRPCGKTSAGAARALPTRTGWAAPLTAWPPWAQGERGSGWRRGRPSEGGNGG